MDPTKRVAQPAGALHLLMQSGLFDADSYIACNQDVPAGGCDLALSPTWLARGPQAEPCISTRPGISPATRWSRSPARTPLLH